MKTRKVLIAVVALLLVGGVSHAQVDPATVFELEGDIVDTPGNILDDWVNLNCSAGFNPPSALISTGAIFDDVGPSIFTQGGSKDPNDVSQWRHKDGSVPDKDEIINAYAAQYGANGATILVVGGDRAATSGSAFIGAWFFQDEVVAAPDGTFDDAAGNPALHRDGDILILAEFSQGGSVGTVKVFNWVAGDPSVCPPDDLQKGDTLCDITPAGPITTRGFINGPAQGPQTIPCPADWQYTPKGGMLGDPIPQNAFFEVGIDLTVLDLGNVCFANFLLETRSSFEVNSQLKDFVLGTFAPCDLECSKDAAPAEACFGEDTVYTYTAVNPGGVPLTVTLDDDFGTPGDPADDICIVPDGAGGCMTFAVGDPSCSFSLAGGETKSCTDSVSLSAGTFVNTLSGIGSPESGGALELTCGDSATVVVNPNPVVTINHLVCDPPATSYELSTTVVDGTSPYTYSWNEGDTTPSIIRSVGGSFQVTVTDAKGCEDTAIRNVGYCSN